MAFELFCILFLCLICYHISIIKSKKFFMKKFFLLLNAEQTKKIAVRIIKKVTETKNREIKSILIGLKGDLGSGKTTFVQGLAKELGIKEKITSPTFTIIKKYKILNQKYQQYKYLYHIDCYRIEDGKEILCLGLNKIINSSNIIVVEWPEKIKQALPFNIVLIEFVDTLKYMRFSKNLRKIILNFF